MRGHCVTFLCSHRLGYLDGVSSNVHCLLHRFIDFTTRCIQVVYDDNDDGSGINYATE